METPNNSESLKKDIANTIFYFANNIKMSLMFTKFDQITANIFILIQTNPELWSIIAPLNMAKEAIVSVLHFVQPEGEWQKGTWNTVEEALRYLINVGESVYTEEEEEYLEEEDTEEPTNIAEINNESNGDQEAQNEEEEEEEIGDDSIDIDNGSNEENQTNINETRNQNNDRHERARLVFTHLDNNFDRVEEQLAIFNTLVRREELRRAERENDRLNGIRLFNLGATAEENFGGLERPSYRADANAVQ